MTRKKRRKPYPGPPSAWRDYCHRHSQAEVRAFVNAARKEAVTAMQPSELDRLYEDLAEAEDILAGTRAYAYAGVMDYADVGRARQNLEAVQRRIEEYHRAKEV